MQNMSTQWNLQHSRYLFSKVIDNLEQNIRKHISCERPSTAKQMNRVQNICVEICKQKHNQVNLALAVFALTKLALIILLKLDAVSK